MRLDHLDLNRLVALDVLLEECSVSRAAHRLHLSQPAASAALAALREHFADALLVPAGRTMRRTPFARELAAPVRDLLLQARSLAQRRAIRDLQAVERTVSIVASDSTAAVLLAPMARRAMSEAPRLRLEIQPVTDDLQRVLERGDVDFVIAAEEALSASHPSEQLLMAPYACLVCRDHPQQGHLNQKAYLEAQHVTLRWSGGQIEPLESTALRSLGLQREIFVEVPSFTLLPEFLVGTPRIATVPRPIAEHAAQRWALRVANCPVEVPPLRLMMQWSAHAGDDPVLLWMRGSLRDIAGATGALPGW